MKGRFDGIIKSMERDANWVHITVQDATGVVTEGDPKPGVDSKSSGADVHLRVKPLMAEQLRFGSHIHFTWSTEKPNSE